MKISKKKFYYSASWAFLVMSMLFSIVIFLGIKDERAFFGAIGFFLMSQTSKILEKMN